MKPPSTVEQPPQSLTLSLRISEVLRKRLEDIRQFTAKRTGGIVSTSEIAKQLLESAREDQLEVVGLLALSEGYKDRAVEHFREAVRFEPDDAGKLTLLGVACIDSGREEEGSDWLRQALKFEPDYD